MCRTVKLWSETDYVAPQSRGELDTMEIELVILYGVITMNESFHIVMFFTYCHIACIKISITAALSVAILCPVNAKSSY